jgi:hypothetical protein
VLLFVGWNGWSLWLFGRHGTGLLPGQAPQAMIEQGPYRLSRNPLYLGLLALYLGLALLAPTFWGLVLFLAAVLLVRWARSAPRSATCTSGSVRRTTTTPDGCAAGYDWAGGIAGRCARPPENSELQDRNAYRLSGPPTRRRANTRTRR